MDLTNPVTLRFFTEIYEKENKNIKFVEKFSPSIKDKSITGKFYSKYDTPIQTTASLKYLEFIERHTEKMPKEIYSYKPPTVNMEYGWFSDQCEPPSTDQRLRFPLKVSDVVKMGMQSRQMDKNRD